MAETTDNGQSGKSTGAADVRAAVENAKNAKDESQDSDDDDADEDDNASGNDGEGDDDGSNDSADDADNSDDTDGDDEGDDDEEEDKSDKSKSQKTDRKYKQYAGDGSDKSYISNLEKAHQSSTTEAINLRTELNQANGRIDAIMRAAAADPDLAAKLNAAVKGDGSGGDAGEGDSSSAVENPFVKDLQAQWTAKSEQEIEAFIEANPEVASDPKIKADVQHWMQVFSNDHFNRTGRLLSGGEAMAQAYRHLDLENKLGKQNLAAGAKKSAAPARPRGKAKSSNGQKPSFTSAQLEMAKAMGKDESWLAKNSK